MARITDANGVWEVTYGNGCINKCLVEPSAEYLKNNPIVEVVPELTLETMAEQLFVTQEQLNSAQDALDFLLMGGI